MQVRGARAKEQTTCQNGLEPGMLTDTDAATCVHCYYAMTGFSGEGNLAEMGTAVWLTRTGRV